jgi:hypothetical protein
LTKFVPFTTRPRSTSKQGITRLASMVHGAAQAAARRTKLFRQTTKAR